MKRNPYQVDVFKKPAEVYEDLWTTLDVLQHWLTHLPDSMKQDLYEKCAEIQAALTRKPVKAVSKRTDSNRQKR